MPLTLEEAEELARTVITVQPRPEGAPRLEFPWVGAFELPAHWAFLFWRGEYIPPGTAVVVDKHTRVPTRYRYVDIEGELYRLGFDITPGRGLTNRPQGPPPKYRFGAQWVRQDDELVANDEGALIPVEVWHDDVTGMRGELDRAGMRIRFPQAEDASWKPFEEG